MATSSIICFCMLLLRCVWTPSLAAIVSIICATSRSHADVTLRLTRAVWTGRAPIVKANQKGRICHTPVGHWLICLGYVGVEFTLQITFGAKIVCCAFVAETHLACSPATRSQNVKKTVWMLWMSRPVLFFSSNGWKNPRWFHLKSTWWTQSSIHVYIYQCGQWCHLRAFQTRHWVYLVNN